MFSRIIKEITVAVREGGYDPDGNPRLRLAIQNAKGASMPKENIERAINKGKDRNASDIEEITYEGYLSHGIAVYIECATDNSQRTVSNIRSIFNKYNGSLGKNGSLAFLFERKGVFTIPTQDIKDKEAFELEMIDAGAEDIEDDNGFVTITTSIEDFGAMQRKLEEMELEAESAELQRVSHETVTLEKEEALKIMKIIEIFEDDEDVQNVFHNLEITDEVLEEI